MANKTCCVPNCVYNAAEKRKRKRKFFTIKRPEFGKTPEERKHRQMLTDVILRICEKSKLQEVKSKLHRERIYYCDKHFFDEDFISNKRFSVLRHGAIPVMNVPFLTTAMKSRLEERQRKVEKMLHANNQTIPKPKRIKRDTNPCSDCNEGATKCSHNQANQLDAVYLTLNEAMRNDIIKLQAVPVSEIQETKPNLSSSVTVVGTNNISPHHEVNVKNEYLASEKRNSNHDRELTPVAEIHESKPNIFSSTSVTQVNVPAPDEENMEDGTSRNRKNDEITTQDGASELSKSQLWDLILKMIKFCNKSFNIIEKANLKEDSLEVDFVSICSEVDHAALLRGDTKDSGGKRIYINDDIPEDHSAVDNNIEASSFQDNLQDDDSIDENNSGVSLKKLNFKEIKFKRPLMLDVPKTPVDAALPTSELSKKFVLLPTGQFKPIADSSVSDHQQNSVTLDTLEKMEQDDDAWDEAFNSLSKKDQDAVNKRLYAKYRVPHEEWGEAYKCDCCQPGHEFNRWHKLKRHQNGKVKDVECEICHKLLAKRYYNEHKKVHSEPKKHKCENCGKQFRQGQQLQSHMESHFSCTFPSYECDVCKQHFMTENEIFIHFQETHDTCGVCEIKYSDKCFNGKHNVTLLKLYKCRFCDEKFSFKPDLVSHVKKFHDKEYHSREMRYYKNTYKCPECNKSFPLPCKLKIHMKMHIPKSEKLYLCEYCSLPCRSYLGYTSHVKTHSKELKL